MSEIRGAEMRSRFLSFRVSGWSLRTEILAEISEKMWYITVFPPSDRTLEVLSAQKIADTGEGLKKGRAERTEILEGWRK